MVLSNIATVTRFTWLEIRRARLWWFMLAMIVFGYGIGEFAASISITESNENRLVFYAAIMRLVAVFFIALLVATSVLREIDDKGLELALSRPLSRGEWYIGKLVGYASAAIGIAVLVSVPLLVQNPLAALIWSYSLMLELIIVVAAALAFAITLRQITIALSVVAGFYIISRAIAGLVLISTGPTVDLTLSSNQFVAAMIKYLAMVLPDLDRFTQTRWLVGMLPSAQEISVLTAQAIIYGALLVCMGLFDLHRREL
ncbi:MAG: Cu-processing system permease protein [Gammaproteobacteria bacterium]|jgi:Cu-processing system permease protein